MIIAATGLTGGIGRHFPNQIIGLKTRLESSSDEMFNELTQNSEIDCVIHLAAMTLVKECDLHPEKAHELNVNGALKWFEAAGKAGIKHFIFTSTSHVYGNPYTEIPIPPSYKLSPVSVYGKTKVEAEIKLKELAEKFPGTRLTIARLFSVLSKESKPGLLYSNLYRRAQEKDFSPVPGLHYTRDFIPAEQVVERLIHLASWTNAPPVVHISSGQGRKIIDLAAQVFAEYGLDAYQLLSEAPSSSNDIPAIVGEPTSIPKASDL